VRKYSGATIGLVDAKHWTRLGKAYPFFEFLISKQTDPSGLINSGRPVTYSQLLAWIPNAKAYGLTERKLRRLMAICKRHGYVKVERRNSKPDLCLGIIVRIANPKKFRRLQGELGFPQFPQESTVPVSPKNGGLLPQKAAHKTLTTEESGEKFKTRTRKPRANLSPDEHKNRIENRNRRLLRDLDVAKEIACGGPIELPRSWRDLHPEVFRGLADLAKAKAL